MKNNYKRIILLIIIVVVMLITIITLKNNVNLRLLGKKEITIELNSKYKDEGYEAKFFSKDISEKVVTESNLNLMKVGNYSIKYNLDFLGKKYQIKRIINVIDKQEPTIELKGEKEIEINVNEKYIDEGAVAYDNYDEDLSDNIRVKTNLRTNKVGTYEIIYSIKDSSGNKNSVTRKVIVKDMSKEIIKYIQEKKYDVSIGYYNLGTGNEFFYQENKIYYGASLIKTLDAIYLYDNNMVNDELKEYIKKAISVSDNDSHHYLINYIGKDKLKEYGIKLGAKNTLTTSGYYGNTTVKDQMVYLKKLYSMTQNNNELKSFFINDYGNYLQVNNIAVMHKYGYYGQYYHNVGIVLDETPYIIVILSNHGNENTRSVINDIAELMYKYHKNNI